MIGCVNDAPAPVLEIVSGADVTTEVSVVGKASDVRAPAAPGPGDGAEPADETTELSSVGNCGAARRGQAREILRRHAMGEGSGFCGSPDSAREVCLFQAQLADLSLVVAKSSLSR